MKLHTTSEVISLAKKLENESAKFYENLSLECVRKEEDKELLLSFARENRKNITQIERAYYGVITDAIEGCFAFDIEADEYALETTLMEKAACSGVLNRAVEIEEKMIKFYSEAAEQSKSLMADVPATFVTIAKKRTARVPRLKSLLEKEDSVKEESNI